MSNYPNQGQGQFPYQNTTPSYPAYPPSGQSQTTTPQNPYPPTGQYPGNPAQNPYPPTGQYPGNQAQPAYPPTGQYPGNPAQPAYPPTGQYPGNPAQPAYPPTGQYPGNPAQPAYPPTGQYPGNPAQPAYPPTGQYPGGQAQAAQPAYPATGQYPGTHPKPSYPATGQYPGGQAQAAQPAYPATGQYPGTHPKPAYPATGQYPAVAPKPSCPATGQYPAKKAQAPQPPTQSTWKFQGYPPQTPYQAAISAGLDPSIVTNLQPNYSIPQVEVKPKQPKPEIKGPAYPTLRADPSANAANDAKALLDSFKGIGCNKKAIRNILTRRCAKQREQIKLEYYKLTSKCIITRARSELYEPYERAIVSLLYTGPDLDAFLIRKATKGSGTDESSLIHILCSRSYDQIKKIEESYKTIFNRDLLNEIKSETSGSFRELLTTLCTTKRDENSVVDMMQAAKDATELMKRNTFKINAPANLIPLFCVRSYAQILQMCRVYQEISGGKTLYSYMKSFINGDYEKALISIYHYALHPTRYFAKYVRRGIECSMINSVIDVFATRCEIDLGNIDMDYKEAYQSTLADDIQTKFRGQTDSVETLLMCLGKI